jgi:hypothetical protein
VFVNVTSRGWRCRPMAWTAARTASRSLAPESTYTAPRMASTVVAIMLVETRSRPGAVMMHRSRPSSKPRRPRLLLLTRSCSIRVHSDVDKRSPILWSTLVFE